MGRAGGELGGDKVSVYAATTRAAGRASHRGAPEPDRAGASADLLICSGSELEIGWVPLLLTQSGNSRISRARRATWRRRSSSNGSRFRKTVDRSLGDIHPAGNPHVHTDPRNIARVAEVLTQRLAQIDSADAEVFKSRAESFKTRWQAAIVRWEKDGRAAEKACRWWCFTRTCPTSSAGWE